ncbi:hypothetical protein NT05HA_2349 [Aggregatibacter aphrophilus NJ8700]|nr:hypothetical protein NT05HA_2349 [Aggregatibacter aphrophilus NJ8700]
MRYQQNPLKNIPNFHRTFLYFAIQLPKVRSFSRAFFSFQQNTPVD